VLHGQDFIEAGIDGRQDQLVPAVPELAAIERGELPLQDPADQALERELRGVGFGRDTAVDDAQDIAGVDPLQSRLHALGLDIGVVVDLRRFRGVTS
jgi:hypothetical protein